MQNLLYGAEAPQPAFVPQFFLCRPRAAKDGYTIFVQAAWNDRWAVTCDCHIEDAAFYFDAFDYFNVGAIH
nr:hypothetical protein [Pseudomonas sp. DR 5-09]